MKLLFSMGCSFDLKWGFVYPNLGPSQVKYGGCVPTWGHILKMIVAPEVSFFFRGGGGGVPVGGLALANWGVPSQPAAQSSELLDLR